MTTVLSTRRIVEYAIKESDSHLTERQLLTRLPQSIDSNTLHSILLYFFMRNKIIYGKNKTIIWTDADNPAILELLDKSVQYRP